MTYLLYNFTIMPLSNTTSLHPSGFLPEVSQHFEAQGSFKASGTAHPVTQHHPPVSPASSDFLLNQTGRLQNSKIFQFFCVISVISS
jgi:hypothetical protein